MARRRSTRPSEFIVYTTHPPYPGSGCKVRTMRIPRGKTFHDVRDYLPPSVGRLAVVSAYSASTAREYARDYRGIRCNGR
jgi:hypothetical protein